MKQANKKMTAVSFGDFFMMSINICWVNLAVIFIRLMQSGVYIFMCSNFSLFTYSLSFLATAHEGILPRLEYCRDLDLSLDNFWQLLVSSKLASLFTQLFHEFFGLIRVLFSSTKSAVAEVLSGLLWTFNEHFTRFLRSTFTILAS